jgi:hypothetical protein
VILLTQSQRSVSALKITVTGEPDQWADLYELKCLPAISAGSVIVGHLTLQLENPSAMPANIAWLRTFTLTPPDGKPISLWATKTSNGHLGANITRNAHYYSPQESFVWQAPHDIPAGAEVAYRGRARTSTIKGHSMIVMDKGQLTLLIHPR